MRLETIGRSESGALILVAENVICVLDRLSHLVHVELDDEEGGEVEAERLVISCSIVAEGFYCLEVGIDEESCRVEKSCSVENILDK